MNIVVSSQIQNVGKSSLALLLTFALVNKRAKVLLIDADIGRWTLAERLGLKKDILMGNVGVRRIKELGFIFDFGVCDQHQGIEPSGDYQYVIVDLDVTRSAVHNDFYFGSANLILIPQPSWTPEKIKDWVKRFIDCLEATTKAKTVVYPIALKYDDMSLNVMKWTNYEVYEAWKKKNMKIIEQNGIGYDEDWAKYISLQEYDGERLNKFVQRTIKTLGKDFEEWLK